MTLSPVGKSVFEHKRKQDCRKRFAYLNGACFLACQSVDDKDGERQTDDDFDTGFHDID